MRNKKGFTLVELLAVIVILGLIAVIAAPLVLGTINSSKDSLSKEQKNRIIEAAKIYAVKNGHCGCVTIADLHSGGFIESEDIANPKDGSNFGGGVKLEWKDNQYVYSYDSSCSTTNKIECPKEES